MPAANHARRTARSLLVPAWKSNIIPTGPSNVSPSGRTHAVTPTSSPNPQAGTAARHARNNTSRIIALYRAVSIPEAAAQTRCHSVTNNRPATGKDKFAFGAIRRNNFSPMLATAVRQMHPSRKVQI
jgi:hypothetical protein